VNVAKALGNLTTRPAAATEALTMPSDGRKGVGDALKKGSHLPQGGIGARVAYGFLVSGTIPMVTTSNEGGMMSRQKGVCVVIVLDPTDMRPDSLTNVAISVANRFVGPSAARF
jgi:hypothetical protein